MKKLDCILLVDDDEDCNFFHRRLIKKMGCAERIEEAKNGLEALELIKSERACPIDMILLDINMPVMDGWTFLAEYEKLPLEKRACIVVVMLTSSVNSDDVNHAHSQSVVSAFVNKYLDESRLRSLIESKF